MKNTLSLNIEPYLALFDHAWQTRMITSYSLNERIHDSIRYVLAGDGKRVRALSALMSAKACGKDPRIALSGACAVEMIHAYSLVHDDLPCMDDDDWRRGRLSAHRAFDEATALLTGDALLTDAFRVLSDPEFFPDNTLVSPEQRAKQVAILARAAGGHGMVLGQARDLWWTARDGATLSQLNSVHLEKTGALLGASCAIGAAAADAAADVITRFYEFGRLIGLAFQAIDDTLDKADTTGKSVGKDEAQNKLTFMKFHETSEIRSMAKDLTKQAVSFLSGTDCAELVAFAESLVFRGR